MKTVETINDNCGVQYVFVIPVIAIFLSGIFAAVFMPETHGLDLIEIRKLYSDEVSKIPCNVFEFISKQNISVEYYCCQLKISVYKVI